MSSPVSRLAPLAAAPATAARSQTRTEKLDKAAQDFEAVMVKQLLKEAHVAGSDGPNGYGDMAIDALSSAVEAAGGLGLAQTIERSLAGKP